MLQWIISDTNYSQRDTTVVTNSTPHNPSLLNHSAQFFFFFFKLCNSEIWFHSESHTRRDATFKWLTERATCQIRNSKSWGHSAYWKFPMVAWRGKWGKEEGKGERRMVDREQFPGCGHRAQTSHQHTIISKDAKHYWPNSTWLKSI